MSDGLRPSDIRHASPNVNPKDRRKKHDKKYRETRRKAFRAYNNWKQKELASLHRFDAPTDEQKLELQLHLAREVLIAFKERTGRDIRLRATHFHLERRKIKVQDVIARDLKKPKSYLVLTWQSGHRRWLNRRELRYLCVKFGVKYWNQMTVKEQMAVLLYLAHWDGIDLETDEIVGDVD